MKQSSATINKYIEQLHKNHRTLSALNEVYIQSARYTLSPSALMAGGEQWRDKLNSVMNDMIKDQLLLLHDVAINGIFKQDPATQRHYYRQMQEPVGWLLNLNFDSVLLNDVELTAACYLYSMFDRIMSDNVYVEYVELPCGHASWDIRPVTEQPTEPSASQTALPMAMQYFVNREPVRNPAVQPNSTTDVGGLLIRLKPSNFSGIDTDYEQMAFGPASPADAEQPTGQPGVVDFNRFTAAELAHAIRNLSLDPVLMMNVLSAHLPREKLLALSRELSKGMQPPSFDKTLSAAIYEAVLQGFRNHGQR